MPMRSWNPIIKIFAYYPSFSLLGSAFLCSLARGKTYTPSIYRKNCGFTEKALSVSAIVVFDGIVFLEVLQFTL